ncbi:M48 family metallopeptidase [Entomobacter blattae]|uniref:YgjP-like metallopeptidase domain-containing protein n=1 Tax=Entomobacter blattae TaxID=2762277 RepID=A0A7H1NPI1_9PROT|nr:SprT family zinc-dependent metalloprotease [Entomobacter blattae]QNT77691.1 hypothetical protein JGUZn3_04410 [Entomobacter blattae]
MMHHIPPLFPPPRLSPKKSKKEAYPQEFLALEGNLYPLQWKIIKRARRISLHIHPIFNTIIVVVPAPSFQDKGRAFVRQNQAWLLNQLHLAKASPAISFQNGEVVSIVGHRYTICHSPTARRGVWIENHKIYVSGETSFLSRRVYDFLKTHAYTIIYPRLRTLSEEHGLPFKKLSITETVSRWGSCSSTGAIRLSWRLILAPELILHYVMSHELAHTQHLNHGPLFWQLVDKLAPNRKEAELWLKKHGLALLKAGKP